MIGLFFSLLSLLIILRIIFSFTGYNHGSLYNIVYTYSEKILKPIRKLLPASRLDWSPFIALVLIDTVGKLLNPLVQYIVNGQYDMILPLFLAVFIALLSSITVFLIIIFIVKIVNDAVKGNNYALTSAVDLFTDPIIRPVKKKLPFRFSRYSVWVILVLLLLAETAFQHFLSGHNI